jgi:hypothetical protein
MNYRPRNNSPEPGKFSLYSKTYLFNIQFSVNPHTTRKLFEQFLPIRVFERNVSTPDIQSNRHIPAVLFTAVCSGTLTVAGNRNAV